MWSTIFFLCAIVAIFSVLHGLVHQDEQEACFVVGLILFLFCIWMACRVNIYDSSLIELRENSSDY